MINCCQILTFQICDGAHSHPRWIIIGSSQSKTYLCAVYGRSKFPEQRVAEYPNSAKRAMCDGQKWLMPHKSVFCRRYLLVSWMAATKTTTMERDNRGHPNSFSPRERPLMTSDVFWFFWPTYLPMSHFVPFRKCCPFYDVPFCLTYPPPYIFFQCKIM